MSYQRVIVEGNLGKDPELQGEGDKTRAKFSIAVSEKRGGEESVEWFSVVCFGKTAENAAKYLSKGRSALVEGRLSTRKYEKDGQQRQFTELVADRVVFTGGPAQGERGEQRMSGGKQPSKPSNTFTDDEIPF